MSKKLESIPLPDESDLNDLVRYFQIVLGLENWEIVIFYTKASDFTSDSKAGDVEYNLHNRKAVVRVLDPSLWDNHHFAQDVPRTVAHELVHLLVSQVAHNPEVDVIEENVVNSLAYAVCDLMNALKVERARNAQDAKTPDS